MKMPHRCMSIMAVLILGCVAAAAAQTPRRVMAQAPAFVGTDVDANLYIIRRDTTLIAYDMGSGEARWTYDAWPLEVYLLYAMQGKRTLILGGIEKEQTRFAVLKKASGEVLWERTERSYDRLAGLTVLPDSDWFTIYYAQGNSGEDQQQKRYGLLFPNEGGKPYRVPEGMSPLEWREAGKTLVLSAQGENAVRLVLWDLGSGAIQDIGTYPDGFYVGRLHPGGLLLCRFFKDPNQPPLLKVVDESTGRPQRTISLPGPMKNVAVIQNGRAILIIGEDGDRVWLLDAATDAVLAALHQPEHEFILSSISEDVAGRTWIFSRDEEDRGYVWPVENDAVPRRVFDPGPAISGACISVHPPHVITVTNRGESKRNLRAFNFEERRLVAEWTPSPPGYIVQVLPSHTMRRCAVMLPGSEKAQGRGGYTCEILEAGASEPLVILEDRWMLVLSPDGDYAVTQPMEDCPVLIQVATGKPLYEFPMSEHTTWAFAAFAPDSRTVAVYGGFDAYTVVRIQEDGITETPLEFHLGTWLSTLCFSPDGTRLLSATRGEAWLHDTLTGRLLHTLVEPQRLRSQYTHTPKVLGVEMPFLNYLGDLAGNFTNLANSKPRLEAAFAGNGGQVVTIAESQLMRVWDAGTGQSLHTVEAGLSNTRDEWGQMGNAITLSENGAYALASNRFDTSATLWDLNTGAAAKKYTDWKKNYRAMHVSDDGKTIYLVINNTLYYLEGR